MTPAPGGGAFRRFADARELPAATGHTLARRFAVLRFA